MNSEAQKTEEHGNEDQLRARIEDLEKELERGRIKYDLDTQTLKARMREIRDKERKKAFEFKCRYEELLKETQQSIQQSEDVADTELNRRKEAEAPNELNHNGRKESRSNISDKAVQTDEANITIYKERIREHEERVTTDTVHKGDNKAVHELFKRTSSFKESNRALLTLNQYIERTEDDITRLQDELHRCEEKIKELTESTGRARSEKAFLEQENQRLKEEFGKLHLRYSEAAGSLMLDRNPSIADLSDATRPTKLAESFSELYDNQYTDAFQELFGPEEDVIQHLLNICMKIHRACQRVASEYINRLEETTIKLSESGRTIFNQTTEIPASTRKYILEIRKSVSEQIIKELLLYFRDRFVQDEENIGKQMDSTAKYIEKCTELCWCMAIKDPPVVLGDIPTEGSPVNTDLFRFYTRSGNYVRYCVWPPLLLHKGGALLRKGIVQGK
ncbi:hypothetical protein CHS0354_009722 [Potamilus streckersoni]|uniref:Mitochondria-eating protein C-terminal domain-containing protein n=1 Tax=Potamilus streckersoni TaxID=2493646 RepID=A0AAE0VN76_9BIVA|nr:hypothetical protein CHS0354_009722 [Potamilus streckersoni]